MTTPPGRRLAAERWPDARTVGAARSAVHGCGPGCQRRGHIVAQLNERTST